MGKEMLLEIGTEEIPAAFIPKAISDIKELAAKNLADCRLPHGDIKAFGTPRRLCLYIADLADKQEDQVIEKIGPAKAAAFDQYGAPSKAAIGFARAQAIDVSDLESKSTEKGEYICARKRISGQDTIKLLPDFCLRLITSIPFRKSMRWANFELRFARPIHWILALFDDEVIPFQIENIVSGSQSRGHRFMSPDSFDVKNFQDYLKKTADAFVNIDPEERRRMIIDQANDAAKVVGGKPYYTDDLLETVVFLVEYPSVVCGSFDNDFLRLPKEVLMTTMISHQKYFPILDENDTLIPYFIVVNNTIARNPSIVTKGNEKVIRARLSDAQFFFEEDQKVSLDQRVEGLRKVVFHSLLGTSYEKVMRFRELAAFIVEKVDPALKDAVDRTAFLAKADLDTQMVCEFTELQGVMGREYAALAGEPPIVSQAIFDHYLPLVAGGDLPQTNEGAIVSIADKMDTIVGFFGVNLIPTGTTDPYALRRQALGIINIILQKNFPVSLDELVDKSLSLLADKLRRSAEETKASVIEFFRGRLANQLISQGHSHDVVEAVIASGIGNLSDTIRKIEAMESFKSHPDFEPLTIAFKRVVNILKGFTGMEVKEDLFESDEEKNLHASYKQISEDVKRLLEHSNYVAALASLALLRGPVDAFFEGVLVMAQDERIRLNRLSLLNRLADLFYRIADFSKITTISNS
jgi:glycyl-tRNA synthetase beta chain